MDELIRELIHLGLSDKEASVYLACLELSSAPVQDIATKAKVNRATTYLAVESLVARGLISTVTEGKRRCYVPENPERLLTILRIQRREIEEKEKEFGKTLPMLLALFNTEGERPQIRYLEGPEGLKTVRDIFVKLEGPADQIIPYDDVQTMREMTHGQDEHLRELVERHATCRALLVVKNPESFVLQQLAPGPIKLIPSEQFPIHGEVTVRGNHVFIYSYKSSILSIVIISQEIADTVRALFNLAWQSVK